MNEFTASPTSSQFFFAPNGEGGGAVWVASFRYSQKNPSTASWAPPREIGVVITGIAFGDLFAN